MSFLTRLSLKNRWATFFLAAVITAVSVLALVNLKVELMPAIEMPVTSVITVYPGATPEQIVEEVTKPVEQAVARAGEYKQINAVSSANLSMLIITYEYGVDMEAATEAISRELAGLTLPAGAQAPQLFPISLDTMPVVMLSLSGDLTGPELRNIAADNIIPRLSSIDGVFSANVTGGEEQAVLIPDIQAMIDAGVSAAQLAGILGSSQFNSLDELLSTPLGTDLLLGDLAFISLGAAPGSAVTTTNGSPSIGVMITKAPEANTVEVANAVMAEIALISTNLPAGVTITPIFDQSEFIEQSIADLYREAIVGAILAVLAIFIFLRVLRASLITAISIPLSVLAGFLLMYAAGITINLLTLSAMALAVGRVVDDSIVVLEVIFRHLENGKDFKTAAVDGVKEVAAPIISATISTVVVFIPLMFVGGMVGELFTPFALTVTFALLASLIIAMTVIPALSGFISRKEVQKEAAIELGGTWYQRAYRPSLDWALRHRAFTMITAAVLVVGSFGLIPIIGTTFLPSSSEKMLVVNLEMPLGTNLETTAATARKVEQLIHTNLDWQTYQTTAGTAGMMGGMAAAGSDSNVAAITVVLHPDADLETQTEMLRTLTENISPDAEITVSSGMEGMAQGSGFGSGAFELTVSGSDPVEVDQAVITITDMLSGISGLINIQSAVTQVVPQPHIELDVAAAAQYGIDPETLSGELFLLARGAVVGQVTVNDNNYDLFLSPLLAGVQSPQQMQQILVGGLHTAPLGEIAAVSFIPQPVELLRVNQQPASTVSATISAKDVGAVNAKIISQLDGLDLPSGVEITIGGVYEQMTEGFSQMFLAIGAAIIIAYLVLVVTFRSFRNPFIIMLSLPVACIGALAGLLVTGNPLGISAMMGFLMLVGIVLTNAIVLITLIEHLRRSGMNPRNAILEGGHIRLRPILMTSLSTALAMLPLALGFGEGSIIAGELAIVVIGGLISSTALTLYVVPVVYSLLNRVPVKAE
jgi:HAE1 family hydrophobic/amphiphilic exporter-1